MLSGIDKIGCKSKTDLNYGQVPCLRVCEECYEIVRTPKL